MVIVIATIGFFGYRFIYGDPNVISKSDAEVYAYLVDEKHYSPAEIASIETGYNFKNEKRTAYITVVTFRDEPGHNYEFVYSEKNGVWGIGDVEGGGKHGE
ncbi:DUF3139 domain-containing protein [Alkalicoccobacillus porphyridii]|uniref:DUF3139 domain-containing protein n=1 Tax=Alkalicoccobacillus porphyridii TaxID=2597270 RepID=A0A553ZWX2_9BACI|nr:DUF3139 domain-containing protein [Alkalicoccobacillus porphyridii]TSB45960.1 DUF3139 domain-containing protein [Alkalicoccobacillus porphyridii]